MKPMFTIIVPVYNMENYLIKCFKSIQNQLFKNFQVLVINDGSTDNSRDLIFKIIDGDNRFEYFEKNNGGIGSAINFALTHVKGEYISFIDADDFIDLSMYERLNNQILLNNHPDIIHFGRILMDNKGRIVKKYKTVAHYESEGVLAFYRHRIDDPSLASRVFRNHLFSNVIIYNQNIAIDEMLSLQLQNSSRTVLFINEYFYYTLLRNNSVSRYTYNEKKIEDSKRVFEFMIRYSEQNRSFELYRSIQKYTYFLIRVLSIYKFKEIDKLQNMEIVKNNLVYLKSLNQFSSDSPLNKLKLFLAHRSLNTFIFLYRFIEFSNLNVN